MSDFTKMIGRIIRQVHVSKDNGTVEFLFADGYRKKMRVEGDCCSDSWIEHCDIPDAVMGQELLDVIEDSEDRTEDDTCNPRREPRWDGDVGREHECLDVYQTRFRTAKGDIVLEYRNSSNGYYGGYLVDVD